ncbi:MAG: tRNA (N(6)-L-threonylcarbamoyladenosine(37)-C(2))-methylthiotransferase MtaB [Clostridiales bacterium]|jgi:threonylcarbamoyladenosine tRNA methylthiotransferase MtaB|nr:tRNA (N(6)-L-threonylcarbamoyladenosine(37)-C(2))-methylthiotransferase MtaB [Clostridiales bacterium]
MSLHDNAHSARSRVAFYTLGCKVNQHETELMRAQFEQSGYTAVPWHEEADVYVINTCTVTSVSDKKSRQAITRAHHTNPHAAIVAVGCYVQRAADEIQKLPGVKLVVGTRMRNSIIPLLQEKNGVRSVVEDISHNYQYERLDCEEQAYMTYTRMRVQLKIQDGCDRYCSYCVIPYARGPARSRPIESIVQALRLLGEQRAQEVVLTGIHLMSYGKEDKALPKLQEVTRLAAGMGGIGRIRLGSLDPALVDDAFVDGLDAIAPGKLCRHFHLSLQSGSDAVLKRMNRRYTADAYERAAARLRARFPGCALTTDVIAGFPGETEADHKGTLAYMERLRFSRTHVFPYSGREGTAAYAMPDQVGKSVRAGRAKELIALGEKLELDYVKGQIGQTLTVLPEARREPGRDESCEGYADNYVRVKYEGYDGTLTKVRIEGREGTVLLGKTED